MKKITITSLLFLFILPLCTFGQAAPFSVQKTGEKGSPILFIPGLACSAEVCGKIPLRSLVLIISATYLLWQDLQGLLQ